MPIEVNTTACPFGWGPCEGGWSHECGRKVGHPGRHVCYVCRSWAIEEEDTDV